MGRGAVLSDEMWARVEPLLPAQYGKGRPFRNHRQVIEGIVFRYRAGIAWRDLPPEFGPWQTVWKRHRRFSLDGTWDEVLAILQAEADAADQIDWRVSVDSTSSRVHQHGANTTRSSEAPMSYTGGPTE
jgi:transposase